eukprot:scaffold323052_cov33-Tisochrysis_lutea.AAC.3
MAKSLGHDLEQLIVAGTDDDMLSALRSAGRDEGRWAHMSLVRHGAGAKAAARKSHLARAREIGLEGGDSGMTRTKLLGLFASDVVRGVLVQKQSDLRRGCNRAVSKPPRARTAPCSIWGVGRPDTCLGVEHRNVNLASHALACAVVERGGDTESCVHAGANITY